MADAVFLDILPRFDWAASEAGTRKLVGQFDSAAKQISRTFGVEAGNAATQATEKIAADMRAMQDVVSRTTNAATEDFRRLSRANSDLEVSTRRITEVTERYGASSSQAARAMAAQTDAQIRLAASTDAYAASMAREAQAADTAAAAQARHAAALEASTSKTAAFATLANRTGAGAALAFAAALGVSADKAGDFEASQMRLVSSAGETRDNLAQVSDGILKMAGDVGYSAQELSKGMYTVESGGFRGAEGLKVMQAAAQGAKAENADLTEVNQGLTTSLTDFHLPADRAAEVMSKMVTAVGMSKSTFQEFTGSLHSVEPAAAAAGIKLDDVYATLARMTQSGMSAQQATENMRNAINSLSVPNAQQAQAMAQLGISADDVSQKLSERGLAGTMQYLSDTIRSQMDPSGKIAVNTFYENAVAADQLQVMLANMSPAAAQVAQAFQAGTMSRKEFTAAIRGSNAQDAAQLQNFGALENKLEGFSKQVKGGRETIETYNAAMKMVTGTVAGQSVALQVSGENADGYNRTLSAISKTTTEADGTVKGFNETQETMKAKLADAKAAFGAATIQLGNDFLPTVTRVINTFADFGRFLSNHKALLDGLIITVGALGTAWAAVKVAMALQTTFNGIVTGLGWVITKAKETQAAVALTATELQGLAPAAAVGAAGVETAAAAEVTAVGTVTTAAGAAKAALMAVGTVLAGIVAGKELSDLSMKIPAVHDNFMNPDGTMKNSIDRWIVNNDVPVLKWFEPSGAKSNDQAAHDAAAAQQANVDEVNRRLAASGVGPKPSTLAPAPPTGLPPGGEDDHTQPASLPTTLDPSAGGASAKESATATAPNISTNRPYAPLDLDPTHTPFGMSYDDWISGQQSAQQAQDRITDTGIQLAQANERMAELTKKGTATQSEWNSAAEALSKAQRENQQAVENATVVQNKNAMKQYDAANKPGEKDKSRTGVTGTDILTGDFEFSPSGIAKYFTAMLVNLAVGNPIGKSEAAKLGTSGNPMYVVPVSGGGPFGGLFGGAGGAGGGGAYSGDASILAGVPAGRYDSSGDLAQGLGDCSSAVEDLVNIMDGRPTAGREMNTGNADQWLTAHGFMPGSMPGAFNVGFNGGHMQATLPGGTPFNWGSDAAAARGGVGGTGAFDPSFTSHYYRPTASGAMPGGAGVTPAFSADWNAIAQRESGGNWAINTGNGYQGGLQFSPSSWMAAGGGKYAPSANQATPFQQAMTAEQLLKMQGPGAWPNTFTPGSSGPAPDLFSPENTDPGLTNPAADLSSQFLGGGGEGPVFKRSPAPGQPGGGHGNPFAPGGALSAPGGPLLVGPPGSGGQAPGSVGPFGAPPSVADIANPGLGHSLMAPHTGGGQSGWTAPHADGYKPGPGSAAASAASTTLARPSSSQNTAAYGAGQSPGKGFSSSIGSTAAGMLGMGMPGSAQAGQLIDRTIGYAGQVAGIAASGMIETFLPGGFGDKLAGFDKSWLGKLAIGIAGAHKSDGGGENRAGAAGPPPDPAKKASQQAGNAAAAVKMPDQHQGTGAPPGPDGPKGNGPLIGEMHITQNEPVDGGAVGRDINRYVGGAVR